MELWNVTCHLSSLPRGWHKIFVRSIMVQVSIEVTAMTPSLYSSEDPPLFHRFAAISMCTLLVPHFLPTVMLHVFLNGSRYSIIGKRKDLHALREACLATQVENRTLTELAEQLVRAKNDACWQMLAKSRLLFERWDLALGIVQLWSWLLGFFSKS